MNRRNTALTAQQVRKEIEALIAHSSQRQVAHDHGLTPPQLNQYLRGVVSLSSGMADKFGYEPITVYRKKGRRQQ